MPLAGKDPQRHYKTGKGLLPKNDKGRKILTAINSLGTESYCPPKGMP